MESLWEAVKVLGPSPNFPFSLRRERCPASRKEKIPLPVDPRLIELVLYVSSSQQERADPGPYSIPIEAELSARCEFQRAGLRCLQNFLSCDLARTVRAAGQHFTACSRLREYLLPASPWAPFHPYPHPSPPRLLRARGCVGCSGQAPADPPSETRVVENELGSGDHQLPR